MGEEKNKNKNSFDSFKEWFEDHKLRAVDRLHAQASTLAALAGAALVEYYDHRTGAKQERARR